MPGESIVNPFTTAGKVPADKFVGRAAELQEILSLLNSGQNVSLVGPSQIGKSSLLGHVCQRSEELLGLGQKGREVRCVYLDLQRIRSEEHFWQEAIAALGATGDDPDVLLKLTRKAPVVLCIDEFEKAKSAEGFSVEFWQRLRSYGQESTLALLMATRRPLPEIEPLHTTSPLANIFRITVLREFSEEDSRRLIADYLAPTGVSFNDEEIGKLIADSGGHPARLQAACNALFDAKSAGGPGGRYEASPTFVPDTPQEEDWLWNGVYSRALADFIGHRETRPPLVIGINAPWGAGKSSLMEAIRRRIDPEHDRRPSGTGISLGHFWNRLRSNAGEAPETEPALAGSQDCLTVWFNAWKYSKDEQLWAALVQNTLQQLTARMEPAQRESFFLRLNLKRLDRDKIRHAVYQNLLAQLAPRLAILLGLLAVTVGFAVAGLSDVGWGRVAAFSLAPFDAVALFAVVAKYRAAKKKPLPLKLADYVRRPQYAQKIGFVGEMEEDFRRLQELIPEHPEQRLVIFVDDLDRCSPGKVVELIEAINVFFGIGAGPCIFVLGLDAEFVTASIESTYEKVIGTIRQRAGDGRPLHFGRRFLEKIVQVWLSLPAPGLQQLRPYLKAVLRAGDGGEAGPAPERVDRLAEELRGRAEDLASVDAAVRERRQSLAGDEREALEEAAQQVAAECFTERDPEMQSILEEALEYLERNPRQVKRFLNLFRLAALLDFRERKLTERGLPREHFQRLAKWVALSLRYPLVARRVKKDIAVLERLETAASDDKAWKQLAKESEWKDLLEPAVRDLLKADVQLHGNPIEFAILV